jgi:hypothetical protein
VDGCIAITAGSISQVAAGIKNSSGNVSKKEVAHSVLEGLGLKHIARKWSGSPATVPKPTAAKPAAPAKRAATKRHAASHR